MCVKNMASYLKLLTMIFYNNFFSPKYVQNAEYAQFVDYVRG